ncbi:unnamed protein product, partial [marine sediment metagenome]
LWKDFVRIVKASYMDVQIRSFALINAEMSITIKSMGKPIIWFAE